MVKEGFHETETSKMFQKIKFYNAIAFTLVFLLIFETVNLCNDEEDPEMDKPQWEIFVISIILGSLAGLDTKHIRNKLGR